MTDATTGPGTGARKSADADGTTRRTAAPTPDETERETIERNPENVAGGDSGHGRTVPPFPTPDEARSEDTGASRTSGTTGVTDTTELTEPGTAASGPGSITSGTGSSTSGTGSTARLLPHDECDKLELRLRQAVSGFVDEPRNAVREADQVVEEIAGRFAEAVTRRRRTLRSSWQDGDEARNKGTHPDTEQLRLALRDYRELAERLLHG
ncbi:hypothetical protein [Streptomyces griseorubiginosus]|uniref:hypothetical protein n=1 Tax=Streptomyces griseorubiginosus TaxID=67304 RepID=UPI001AD77018|nr:hypothetical protein [Streptomyces griseorubiginosus]MBO4258648.1 hypothetical protein [Streptomyces griseorubiginosus]